MALSPHLPPMVSIIIFFIVSFYTTLNLIANSPFNAAIFPGLKQAYQSSKRPHLIKFRFLKELTKFKSSDDAHFSNFSPSPAPAPGPSIAPVASPPRSLYRWRHQHHPSMPQAHKAPPHKVNQERGHHHGLSRALTAVLASVGIAFVLLLCAIGLFLGCRKLGNKRRRQNRNVAVIRSDAGHRGVPKYNVMSSQTSVKKVTSDPGPDLFYLDSLESALQSDKNCCLKVSSSSVMNPSRSFPSDEVKSSRKEVTSSGEITAVDEVASEPFDGSDLLDGDHRIIHKPVPSSDDESFHSFCESQASHMRFSNASSCSVGDNLDSVSKDEVKEANCCAVAIPVVPPPPPPPPPPPRPLATSPVIRVKFNVLNSSFQSLSEGSASISSNGQAGIPPPPCPPQHLARHNSSLIAPPPPLPQQIPLGKDGSPLPKLKPLHWDKVRAAPNRTTVWDKLRSSSFEFDEEMIESLFSYNLQNHTKNDEAKSKTPSPNKHILDPKRLQNFTILSKALSVNEEQVCGALVRGGGLTLQDLEALSKMVPTKEEEAKLANYKGDIFELSSAEKLVKGMLQIPHAFSRIEAMLYQETFEDEVLHLRKSFSMLEEACKELRSSRLFLKLLEAVLKTGNRMNIGTIRGGAKAFKLDALLKLADVKGTDGRTTLLHFVVLEIIRSEGLRVSESIMGKIHQKSTSSSSSLQDKEENYRTMGLDLVSGLSSELCNVKKTATIDLDVLASSVTNLTDNMHKLQQLVDKDMIMDEKKGSFVSTMRLFLKYAETKLKALQEDENRVLLQVREITEYFHGDKSKDESNPLRIFVIVRDFLSMLDHVCKELKSSKTSRNPTPLAAAFR